MNVECCRCHSVIPLAKAKTQVVEQHGEDKVYRFCNTCNSVFITVFLNLISVNGYTDLMKGA